MQDKFEKISAPDALQNKCINNELRDHLQNYSKENIKRIQAELGEFNPEEKKIFERIRSFELDFFHRVSVEKLKHVLFQKKILTLESSKKFDPDFKSWTPPSERALYNAQDYVFGWIGFWSATNKFGDIVIHIQKQYWKNHAWASSKSGYEYFMEAENEQRLIDKKPKLTEEELTYDRYDAPSDEFVQEARKFLLKDILAPEDFSTAIAFRLIDLLRRQQPETAGLPALNVLDDERLRIFLIAIMREEYLVRRRKVGFLEGKIFGDIPLGVIKMVQLPKNTPDKDFIINMLDSQGIKYKEEK